jgi:hypothetical protein
MRQQLRQKHMKTHVQTNRAKKRPPHLTYSAFCLATRDQSRDIWRLTAAAQNANSFCPVKRTRALLESNPPRDNWIQRRRNKNVSTFGEVNPSPKSHRETFISEPEHASQNSSKSFSKSSKSLRDGHHQQKTLTKNHLNSYPFFRGKPKPSQSPPNSSQLTPTPQMSLLIQHL